MFGRLLLSRIHEWSTFICKWEFCAFVFRTIAAATSQKQVIPLDSEFVIGGCALWLKVLNVTVINVSNVTFTIGTFFVKHADQRFFDFIVLIPVLRIFSCGIGGCRTDSLFPFRLIIRQYSGLLCSSDPNHFRILFTDILAINSSQKASQIAQLLSLQLNRYVFRAYL